MAQCSKHTHIDGIGYRCSVKSDDFLGRHDGEHCFDEVVNIAITFDGLDDEQIAEIHAQTPDNEFYTQDDIRRALWLALNDVIDETLEDLNQLTREREFDKYLDLVFSRKLKMTETDATAEA